MKSPYAGIAPDSHSIGVNCLVQLASRLVVAGRDGVPLKLGDAVDQRESLAPVFGLEPCVPGIVESGCKSLVSHGEIRIERDGALEQRNSRQKSALAQLVVACRVALESLQRTRGRLFQRTIQLLDRAARFSELGAHGRRGGSHRVQHVLLVVGLDLLASQRRAALAVDRL